MQQKAHFAAMRQATMHAMPVHNVTGGMLVIDTSKGARGQQGSGMHVSIAMRGPCQPILGPALSSKFSMSMLVMTNYNS